jgi:tRNA A58 N-methylase Trm61
MRNRVLSSRAVETVIGSGVLNRSLLVVIPSTAFAYPFRQHEETMTPAARNHPKLRFGKCEQRMDGHAFQSARRVVQFARAFMAVPVES